MIGQAVISCLIYMVFSNFVRCGNHIGFNFCMKKTPFFCPEEPKKSSFCKLVYTNHISICIKLYQPHDGVVTGPCISMIEKKLISAIWGTKRVEWLFPKCLLPLSIPKVVYFSTAYCRPFSAVNSLRRKHPPRLQGTMPTPWPKKQYSHSGPLSGSTRESVESVPLLGPGKNIFLSDKAKGGQLAS